MTQNTNPQYTPQPDWQHTAAQMGHNPAFGPTPPQPPKKRRGLLIAGIAVGALGLVGIANAAGSGATTSTPAVTATATPSSAPTSDWDAPGDEPTETETTEPVDTTDYTLKFGQKLSLTVDGVSTTMTFGPTQQATNMFDKENAENKLVVCNTGDDDITDLSAESLGLSMEDSDGGTYDIYTAYRNPIFPTYDYDGKKLREGKCLTGWVGWEGAWGHKGLAVVIDVEDSTYTWSKSGK